MMKARIRIMAGVTGLLLITLGTAAPSAPAQLTLLPADPAETIMAAGGMQEWLNELGGTDCKGECPGMRAGCCSSMAF
jgi:hypothetical protein